MDIKKEYSYSYGFLSSATRQTVQELELLITQLRGNNKETLKNIHKSLSRSLNTCESNLLTDQKSHDKP